jgi:hypothetical protein
MFIELTVMSLNYPILLNTQHIVSMQRYALNPEITEIVTVNRQRIYVTEPVADIIAQLQGAEA